MTKLLQRIWIERGAGASASAFGYRVERSAEGIKAVPNGIFLNDLSLRLVCHCEWRALDAKRKRGGASCGMLAPATPTAPRCKLVSRVVMSKLCQACGNPTFASACRRAANDGTLADGAAACNPSLRPANHGSSAPTTPSCPGNSATAGAGPQTRLVG